jgi:sterol 3beta-glucosyltransferase
MDPQSEERQHMHIAMIAPGSRGDVQPYVALGKGLMKAGHAARVVTNQNHEQLVKSSGVDFWPIEVDTEDMVRSDKMRAAMEGGSALKSLMQMGKEMKLNAALMAERSLASCQGVDLIAAGISGLFTGASIAEKLGIPFVQAYNLPFSSTREFPGALFPNVPAMPWANRLSHAMTRQMLWMAYQPSDGTVRQQVLGLPRSPMNGPYKSKVLREGLVLYGLSPSMLPRPSDWEERIHITGFWFLDSPDDLEPSPALVEFLEAGPPPIYVGFGSMAGRKPEETTATIVKAVKETGQRAIIHAGWGGLTKVDVPGSVLVVSSAPHAWLFPRCKAVVHHGGAGTTAAGMRAGVPSILVPFHGDQPFWGWLVAKRGVGPASIPYKKLSAERLAIAIKEIDANQEMRDRAASLGTKIRAEDGVAQATALIQKLHKETSR